MIKVSIIIPVYNVADYVSNCIDSVIKQSYSNLEIIIVNDGSTDNSADICRRKANLDSRILYLEKENGGLSTARNYGLKFATGDFIYFLDSDDYLVINAIESLVNEQEKENADIVSSAFMMVDDTQQLLMKCAVEDYIRGDNTLFYLQRITNQACAKLYRRRLFNRITYPIGLRYEDVATTFKLYDMAESVSHTECGLYCYRVREGAITYSIRNQDIEDLWKAFFIIKQHFITPTKEQLFYELTILYTIYSRLLRSNCNNEEFKGHENKIYSEMNKITVNINEFKGKSPMYFKIKLFKWHLTKLIIRIVDIKRKVLA